MSSQEMQAEWAEPGAETTTSPRPRYIEPTLVRRRPDPFLDNYLKRIDPRIAASFTEEQRRAIRSMFEGRAAKRHSVDIRQSLGFGRHRFYLVMLGGRERRLLPKSGRQGAVAQLTSLLAYLALTGGLLAALALFVYHVKG